MKNPDRQQRLWSIPGDGVLARQGDLILLSSIDEQGFVESLLELLSRVSETGGDGRALAGAIGDAVERDRSWGRQDSGPGPAVLAFGPAGTGLALAVSGTAWVEVTTADGTHRLAAGLPSVLVRTVIGVPVQAARAGLGTQGAADRTDRFSRLDGGTVRACGLSYYSGQPARPPAAGRATAPPGTAPPGTAPPGTGQPAMSRPDAVQPAATPPHDGQPATAPAGAAQPAQTPPGAAQPAAPQGAPGTGPAAAAHPAGPSAAGTALSGTAPSGTDSTGPDHGTPGATGTGLEPDPYELGIGDPGMPAPPPAAQTAFGPAAYHSMEQPAVPEEDDDAAGAPIVFGVYCKNGHFGDPEARSCAVCGTTISRRSAVRTHGPRPTLGVLVLDDGATVDVDGDYVIGREPAREPSVVAGEARPLRVVDAESTVSRVHARVHLEGWKVLLTDLGSANGTRIRPPGAKSEQQLDPEVPVTLRHGTRVVVGTQGFRYEPPSG